jgi:MYXO-CTERM domain-containing protein
MKNTSRFSWFVVVVVVALAAPARAAVVWTATFESNKSGDVCSSGGATAEFKPGINEKNGTRINAQVLAAAAHSGTLGCQITVHPDDLLPPYNQDRVDIQHPSTLTDEGKDSYLSGWYMMPADAQMRNEFGFYETNKSFANAMDIWVAPKTGGGTTINFAIGFLPDKASWTADFKAGVWHQVGIHVHWSQTATVGYVDLWLDGVKTVTMLKGKTKPNGDTLFYQTGLHRKLPMNVTDTIVFDDFYEGDAEADMHIAPPGSGTDGGAAGAGGATGTAGSTGSAGSTGTAGATGAAGSTGSAGSTGTAGETGTAGSTGSAGAVGNGGSTGSAGSTGAAGSVGPGGATGGGGTTGSGATNGGGCACATGANGGLRGMTAGVLFALGLLTFGKRRRRRSR